MTRGSWRIEESIGTHSELPLFTLFYMGPEGSIGYGVWEPVKTFFRRSEAEEFIAHPADWWFKTHGSDDGPALDEIAEMLRDPDWGVGMLEDIAAIVRATGRSLDNPEEVDTWDRH